MIIDTKSDCVKSTFEWWHRVLGYFLQSDLEQKAIFTPLCEISAFEFAQSGSGGRGGSSSDQTCSGREAGPLSKAAPPRCFRIKDSENCKHFTWPESPVKCAEQAWRSEAKSHNMKSARLCTPCQRQQGVYVHVSVWQRGQLWSSHLLRGGTDGGKRSAWHCPHIYLTLWMTFHTATAPTTRFGHAGRCLSGRG